VLEILYEHNLSGKKYTSGDIVMAKFIPLLLMAFSLGYGLVWSPKPTLALCQDIY
jgi:hypothetical protein